ncbi:MAG TPA: GtrA family protein [Xanthobacteraceae bacterium]|jgi:putative flippase GtrA
MAKTIEKSVCVPIERWWSIASSRQAWLLSIAPRLPRPVRFLAVGGIGLAADLVLFTLMLIGGVAPLGAGFAALVAATILTWRLNRAFTFNSSGRAKSHEAMRYAVVTTVAQSTSYLVFAVLVSSVLAPVPQAAILVGAACGAIVSYNGHRLFAFAPIEPCAGLPRC